MSSFICIFIFAKIVFSAYPNLREQKNFRIKSTEPSCNPSDAAKSAANWNQCQLNQDNNAWYGIINESTDYHDAAKQCESFGASLVSASDKTIDGCAAYSIGVNKVFDQLVLYSGRDFYGDSDWV